MKLITLTLLIVLCSGCASLVPNERKQSASVKAAETLNTESEKTIRRTLTIAPSIWTKLRKAGVEGGKQMASNPDYASTDAGPYVHEVLEVNSTSTTGAGSKDAATGSLAVSIPLGVKLILLAIGLGLLVLIIWIIRKQSAAVDAAFKVGDNGMAALISQLETWAQTSTNPEDTAKANALLNLANKERGKIGRKK
jgi:hypothetical protein